MTPGMHDQITDPRDGKGTRGYGIVWLVGDTLFFVIASAFVVLISGMWFFFLYTVAQSLTTGFDRHDNPFQLLFFYVPLSLWYVGFILAYLLYQGGGRLATRGTVYPVWLKRWTRYLLFAYPVLVVSLYIASAFVSRAFYFGPSG